MTSVLMSPWSTSANIADGRIDTPNIRIRKNFQFITNLLQIIA
jgi:hypothetical protein